jgi:hypothetical protein
MKYLVLPLFCLFSVLLIFISFFSLSLPLDDDVAQGNTCYICMKGFTQKVHLNTHKKLAHPDKESLEQQQQSAAYSDCESEGVLHIQTDIVSE